MSNTLVPDNSYSMWGSTLSGNSCYNSSSPAWHTPNLFLPDKVQDDNIRVVAVVAFYEPAPASYDHLVPRCREQSSLSEG